MTSRTQRSLLACLLRLQLNVSGVKKQLPHDYPHLWEKVEASMISLIDEVTCSHEPDWNHQGKQDYSEYDKISKWRYAVQQHE